MTSSFRCNGGVVSAPHRLAAAAGAAVLSEGGNAVEAMVAAAAAIAVVYPHMNGIGGDGFWLIHEPGQAPIAIQACGPAARNADVDFYQAHGDAAIPARGPRAALTVAGVVAGWQAALQVAQHWGKGLPLAMLLERAIAHARRGVAVSRSQASLTRAKWQELCDVPGFAGTFAADGPPAEGDILKLPRLAATLEQLANAGLDDFYRGELARSMAHDLQSLGSPVSLADLVGYRARRVTPLSVDLAAGRVFNHPPPTQGVSSLTILGLFDRLGVREADGFAHIHGLVEATKRAFRWRNRNLGDPTAMRADPAATLAPNALDREATQIDPQRAAPWPETAQAGDTVWLGAADAQGRVVSYIQSVYWEFGSGMVLPGSGVQWQNRGTAFTLAPGPNMLRAGHMPFHTLNPALAQLKDGRVLAYGTMGGEGQPQTQAAIFTRHVLFGRDLQAAISAPRWLLGRTWGDASTNLKLESRVPAAVLAALRSAGHEVQCVEAFDDMMGHAGAVSVHPGGMMEAAHDPRSDGGCLGAHIPH